MRETFYKPLTPKLRTDINNSIEDNVKELMTCQNNAYVKAQIVACGALKNFINTLPDGFLIPFERRY